jgi:competence ComEA-like helix-hairpin-helix protein
MNGDERTDGASGMRAEAESHRGAMAIGLFALAILLVWMSAVALQRPLTHREAAPSAPWPDMRINVNTATEAQLTVLPRIGPRLAEHIVADRERNGPFESLDDLTRVHMIGPRTVEAMEPFVYIGPADALGDVRGE